MPAPQRNRGWLWYFITLVVLTLLAIILLTVYNLRQQLTPEQLETARQMWKEKGHRDYTLAYSIKTKEANSDQYLVKVQGGKVVEAHFNGLAEPPERLHYYGMERLFDYMEKFQENDQKKGQPRAFVRANFDPETGGILWYVRSVTVSRERVEIKVEQLEAAKK